MASNPSKSALRVAEVESSERAEKRVTFEVSSEAFSSEAAPKEICQKMSAAVELSSEMLEGAQKHASHFNKKQLLKLVELCQKSYEQCHLRKETLELIKAIPDHGASMEQLLEAQAHYEKLCNADSE